MSRTLRASLGLAVTATIALTGTAGAAESQSSTDDQLLFYNHAYAVVDRETADAIEHSEFLREFADFEVRTTTGGDFTWTGRYLYGHETYLEFFGEGDLPGQDAEFGSSGLGISTEHAGDMATVAQNLVDQGIEPAEGLQTRDFGDGVRVPWFEYLRSTSEQYEAFDPFAMEYRSEYFADPRSNTGPESYPGDVSRARYLPDRYQDHLMRDVTAIHLGVPERDLATTVPLLEAGGYDVQTTSTGIVVDDGGTLIRLDGVPRAEAGLRSIEMSLNGPVLDQQVEQIGNSTLYVGPRDRAVWEFDAPE
ncbi:hypothetical protein E1265_22810 [Streptomyces sp. 8K308]|uniref:DUF5829 family protein n=1 Tax=Streptomyces sp. 8K308 TaxID=2530388 RepID=UPI0010505C15|nr:DUF5829 family protein [Streptomyces sp. 8K308]TDC20117.1 hypothetical protein E1265_22810 [Streptomyces sp. 8K308]